MAFESFLGTNLSSKNNFFDGCGGGRFDLDSVNLAQDDPLADPKFTVPAVEEVG